MRPQTGPLDVTPSPSHKVWELASTVYYTVTLTRDKVKAELTATERSGVHRYTFPGRTVARLLIERGANVNLPKTEGQTALHMAAGWNADLVRALLKAGADPNAPCRSLGTPLRWALLNGNAEAAALLREAGAPEEKIEGLGETRL